MPTLTGFKGDVIAWSIGLRHEVLGSADIELKIPALRREISVLVGVSSSVADIVDGKWCLLHPVVTCLAHVREMFNPPLHLRFPVGDVVSMESGSDCGSPGAEESYRAYLESTFSAVTRADGSFEWLPIEGIVIKVEDSYVLEIELSHFCAFALKREVEVPLGGVELVPLLSLKRESRQSHYHFVNLGTQTLVIYYWGAAQTKVFLSSLRVSLGGGLSSANVGAEADRQVKDVPRSQVFDVLAPGAPADVVCTHFPEFESATIAWTSVESFVSEGEGYRQVQVWGVRRMAHKQAMVFGALPDSAHARVKNLRVKDGEDIGTAVRASLQQKVEL